MCSGSRSWYRMGELGNVCDHLAIEAYFLLKVSLSLIESTILLVTLRSAWYNEQTACLMRSFSWRSSDRHEKRSPLFSSEGDLSYHHLTFTLQSF